MSRWLQSPVVSSGTGSPIWRQPGFWREGVYAFMLLSLTGVFFIGVLALFPDDRKPSKLKVLPALREVHQKKKVGSA